MLVRATCNLPTQPRLGTDVIRMCCEYLEVVGVHLLGVPGMAAQAFVYTVALVCAISSPTCASCGCVQLA